MLAVEGLQQGQHVLGGLAVQVTGGLVADQQHRVADDGPRDGHPLLLAAGQLGRLVRRTVGQAHQLQRDGRALPALAGRQLGQQQRQLDILLRRQRRHQVVELEHEADLGRPPFGQGRTRELVDALTAHGDGTAAGRVQPTHQIEQRGLARARAGHQVVGCHAVALEVRAVEGRQTAVLAQHVGFEPDRPRLAHARHRNARRARAVVQIAGARVDGRMGQRWAAVVA
mmetsp:Transcript_44842/g.105637  ORF Transcript_44842/g.105637 Transcript_44842/m.105637 type:complete len:227 (+) Transcript_44842:1747-2427(+)